MYKLKYVNETFPHHEITCLYDKCPSCGGILDIKEIETTGGLQYIKVCHDNETTGCGGYLTCQVLTVTTQLLNYK